MPSSPDKSSASPSPDIIPMRPDEQLDVAALADYLRGRLPGSDQPLAVRQFGGGAANLTYLLDYGAHDYVLRRPPLGPVPKAAHDMAREFRVLSTLWTVFPPAPCALLFCDDPSVIGAPFFVMERRRGIVVRKEMPPAFSGLPDAPQRIAEALVDALVALHAVEYEKIGLGDLGKPEGFIARQVEGWWQRWEMAKTVDAPQMQAVYYWLRENLPTSPGATLVHNDYKLDNVMLAADDPGQIVAVFDWDMCTLGDPLNDLGALLTYWTRPDDPLPFQLLAMMPLDERFPTRAALAARYAEKSGRDVTALPFYHALGLFRLTGILAQIHARYVRGQTRDARFAALGDLIPVTAQAALSVAKGEWQ